MFCSCGEVDGCGVSCFCVVIFFKRSPLKLVLVFFCIYGVEDDGGNKEGGLSLGGATVGGHGGWIRGSLKLLK